MEHEKAYDIVCEFTMILVLIFICFHIIRACEFIYFVHFVSQIASLLKIPFLDEEVANNSYPRKVHEFICI